jgi:hypothetical protein
MEAAQVTRNERIREFASDLLSEGAAVLISVQAISGRSVRAPRIEVDDLLELCRVWLEAQRGTHTPPPPVCGFHHADGTICLQPPGPCRSHAGLACWCCHEPATGFATYRRAVDTTLQDATQLPICGRPNCPTGMRTP